MFGACGMDEKRLYMHWLLPIAGLLIVAAWLAAFFTSPVSYMDFRSPAPPYNINVETSLGHTCITPCQINIYTKNDFAITFSHPGYRSQTFSVHIESGSDEHSPNPINVIMEPDAG